MLFAQGDILLERVENIDPSGHTLPRSEDGLCVVAEGELTGHRHVFQDAVTMFRDDALARDMPMELYIGHIKVPGSGAVLLHNEHAPISLPAGTYRVRRQRQAGPEDVTLVLD
jgi:hypothetical protein